MKETAGKNWSTETMQLCTKLQKQYEPTVVLDSELNYLLDDNAWQQNL